MLSVLSSVDPINALTASPNSSAALSTHPTAALSFGTSSGLIDPLSQVLMTGASAAINKAPAANLTTSSLISNSIVVGSGADDSMAGAYNMGALSGIRSFTGFVGTSDTQDYYKLTLTGGNVNLSLTGLSADADVQLFNSVGTAIATSNRWNMADETINMSGLASGVYYVRVYQYSGDANYSLKLSNNYSNDLVATETNIGALSGTQLFSGTINNSNTSDFYRFSVSNSYFGLIPTNVNMTLSGLSSDADIRLIRDANGNGIVDGSDVVTGSYQGSTAAEWISTSLQTGTYFLEVEQWSGSTNYHLSISTGDWYSSNLSDAGVIGETRFSAADNYISRNEMIGILRETKDYSAIDATELTDLRKVVSSLGYMMPGYVKNLAGKVVNSDPANPRSGIGNIYAGSSSTQMENLIGKWFLGSDRPDASGTYSYVSGSLFQGGATVGDINQGAVGDCYFMASLGAFASDRPSVLSNMFIDNGDDTFTVRFFNNGTADYVTVDRFLPTWWNGTTGTAVYAGWGGGTNTSSGNELWMALAEKAYAQLNESGWIGRDNTNSYAGIDGGWMAAVMNQISGASSSSQWISSMTQTQLINLVNSTTTPITAGFVSGAGFGVVNSHAYTITSYSSASGLFHLNNPWGNTHADVTWAQLNSLNARIEWSNV